MMFNLVLTFCVLLKTLNAALLDPTVGDVNNIEPNVQRLLQAESDNGWESGVQQFYDGCDYVAQRLPGSVYDLGQNVMSSLKDYTDKLKDLAISESSILQSRSTSILYTLSTEKTLGESPTKIIKEFQKLLIPISSSHIQTTGSLAEILGVELTDSVTEPIDDLSSELNELLNVVKDNGIPPEDIPNINFEPTIRALQKLTSRISLISKTAVNGKSTTSDIYEALTVLTLILDHYAISVQGMIVCIAAIIENQSEDLISQALNAVLQALDSFVTLITNAILSLVNGVVQTLISLLNTLVAATDALNATLNAVLGVVTDLVTLTVKQITSSLTPITSGILGPLGRLIG